MDNYMKMCEQAVRMQNRWKPGVGDYILLKENNQVYLISSTEKIGDKRKIVFYTNINNGNDDWCSENKIKDLFLWLLTQEQLWKKIWGLAFKDWDWNSFKIYKGITFNERTKEMKDYTGVSVQQDSKVINKFNGRRLQECLIQIIYKYGYHKVWTGEKWMKAE